jgi:uncharacterized protein YhdP
LIVRVSKLLARMLLLLVAVAALALSCFVWLLMAGPVSVAWLTPHIERELSTGTVAVDIHDTQLRLGEDHSLDLRAIGVRVHGPNGRLLGELPEVDIGLSTSALLFEHRIAVRRIDAVAPALTLARRADGSIGFAQVSDESDANNLDIGALLADFLTKPTEREASAHLEHIRFSGGELILEDQTRGRSLRARDAELNIDFRADRVAADLRFGIDQATRPALLHLSASHEPGENWIDLDLAFENLLPAEFAAFAPDLPLAGLRLALSGNAQSALSLQGEPAPVRFDVASRNGTIELPERGVGPLPIEALWLEGVVAADRKGVVVDRLKLACNGADLSGQGEVAWRGGKPTLQADLEAKNATVDHIARFWPEGEGREARTWVIENITGGTVPTARARLRFGPGELGQKPLPEHTLAGEFAFQDLSVRYVDTMPPLVGVSGSATFTGQRMDFTVAGGHVGDLALEQGSVTITGIGIEGRDTTQLEIATRVAGPVAQALSLIDQPPLGFASKIGIAPEATSGRVVADLRIGMPLHKNLEPEKETRVTAEATIRDGALAGKPVNLTKGQLKLTVAEQAATLAGEAVVEGVPVKLQVQESLGEGGGVDRRYQVEGSPDATMLKQFGVELPIALEGRVGVSATVFERRAGRTAEVALDFTPTAIAVPQLSWRKASGEPATLTAKAALPAGGPIEITEFALTSRDLSADGDLKAQLEPLRLARLQLDQVRFGQTQATIAVRRSDVAGYDVRIDAQTLDLAPWLDQSGADEEREADAGSAVPFHLSLQAQRLIVRGRPLRDVAADLVRGPDGWRSATVSGKLPKDGAVTLSLAPAGEQQILRLTSSDAGDLLHTLHQTSQIRGGQLAVDATIFRQRPNLQAQGKLVARQFHVLDAPLLARLLTVASLTGIVNLLGGEGIAFEQLDAPFVVRDDLLQFDQGRMYGSQLGLTFQGSLDLAADTMDLDGTIVPLYGINWTIGQIPIIGQLLRGSKGDGAFAATYSMRGPLNEPRISVNPLSALAPGFLRELFSGLREGTLEPPEMLPSHDD